MKMVKKLKRRKGLAEVMIYHYTVTKTSKHRILIHPPKTYKTD